METINDLMPLTHDWNAERLETLKKLFPDLFTVEGNLNEDELKKLVNPENVKEVERYEFRWFGKSQAKRNAFTPTDASLIFDEARSVNPNETENLIIEGENLEVLKLLSLGYREQIKCIYIDPPYNTGKDFVYSDNFNEDRQPYWEQTGGMQDGVKADTNPDTDGRYHSNWLNLMFSRLLIARSLLRNDGVIFISIGNEEIHNLRRLCDEVFGEENHLAMFVWKSRAKPTNAGEAKFKPQKVAEYVLAYVKNNAEGFKFNVLNAKGRVYPHYDEVAKKNFRTTSILTSNRGMFKRETMRFKIGEFEPDNDQRWKAGYDVIKDYYDNSRIGFNDGLPFLKHYEDDEDESIYPVYTFMDTDLTGTAETGKSDLNELIGKNHGMDTVKPVNLLRYFIASATNKDDSILDFFGGSGSTGQAVMELNEEDGGNRKFILVQIPELTDAKSEAYKAGYKKISDITIERNKRVVEKIEKEKAEKHPNLFDDIGRNTHEVSVPDGQEDALTIVRASAQEQNPKLNGFKVFKLAKSYFPRTEWSPNPEHTEAEKVASLREYIKVKEAQLYLSFDRAELLTEILLKKGFTLNYKTATDARFTQNEVLLVTDGEKSALICLDEDVKNETVEFLKANTEQRFICLERGLDTTKKWNLHHYLGEKFIAF